MEAQEKNFLLSAGMDAKTAQRFADLTEKGDAGAQEKERKKDENKMFDVVVGSNADVFPGGLRL